MESTDLFCPIRQKWVASLPEEIVRQRLICQMTQELGYPIGGIVLEKGLRHMPHLCHASKFPKRRTDVIFFAKGIHPHYNLYPLLLIECKAVPINAKVIRQAVSYNLHIQAPFIALVNQEESLLGWYHPSLKKFDFVPGLPSYSQLLAHWSSNSS